MKYEFRAGDRVRVTTPNLAGGDLCGCCGTVLGGKEASINGWESYYVRMDGEAIGAWIVFAAEEIEADAASPTPSGCAASASPESAIAV